MAQEENNYPHHNSDVLEKIEGEVKEPEMYNVILHNDDYTTVDFVIEVLQVIFHKNQMEAEKIMLDVHNRGKGVVGSYTFDIASTKADQVMQLAREREFPLKCTVEKA